MDALAAAFPDGATAAVCRGVRMGLADYALWWHRAASGGADSPELYLKDVHLRDALPAVPMPALFEDDWLGACFDADQAAGLPDLRFVYCGRSGTQTLLHTDIWDTHSWSVNICGRKRWRFVPPCDAHLLVDCNGVSVAPSLEAALHAPLMYPWAHRARVVELQQAAGECVFVPSRWVHCVANVEACLSLNCNWANATNLPHLLLLARNERDDIGSSLQLRPHLARYLLAAAERELAALRGCAPNATAWSAYTLRRLSEALSEFPSCAALAERCAAACAAVE